MLWHQTIAGVTVLATTGLAFANGTGLQTDDLSTDEYEEQYQQEEDEFMNPVVAAYEPTPAFVDPKQAVAQSAPIGGAIGYKYMSFDSGLFPDYKRHLEILALRVKSVGTSFIFRFAGKPIWCHLKHRKSIRWLEKSTKLRLF